MEKDRNRIEKDIAMIVFYMNGGLNYTDAYTLSLNQLNDLSTTVNEHYEKQAQAMNTSKAR